jgi:tetratricopeptide (TPR) repeat protein
LKGYAAQDVARLLGLSPTQVRAFARSGFLDPDRGPRGELRFSFPDLVLLRAAKGLADAKIPQRRIGLALRRLREQLPAGRPLSAVRITAEDGRIVVHDGASAWSPESDQLQLDFAVSDLATRAAPLAKRVAQAARDAEGSADGALGADEWYDLGFDLEAVDVAEARDAYRRALELDPHHADAHVNLGRLLQEGGDAKQAVSHYLLALQQEARNATAWFNLGIALEDLKRRSDAIKAYESATQAEPALADAWFNLSRLYEAAGKKAAALRSLSKYRMLVRRDVGG